MSLVRIRKNYENQTGKEVSKSYVDSVLKEAGLVRSSGAEEKRLESINREIGQFRSILWARSRDFLVDAEIKGETKRMKVLGEKSDVGFQKEDNVGSEEM